jgi:hypothetical protein
MKRGAIFIGLVVLAAGCNDPFVDLGERSQEIVYGDTTTTSTTSSIPGDDGDAFALEPVGAAAWQNDGITPQSDSDSPAVVIAAVWNRSNGVERFIQASRTEIAAALPGVVFPELVPAGVGWITSQLVYDVASASLDAETSAAFGLWTTEPYSVTRDAGQAAVLYIGLSASAGSSEIRSIPVEAGLSLEWEDAAHAYRLYCRQWVPEEVCWRTAESTRRLDEMVPAEG